MYPTSTQAFNRQIFTNMVGYLCQIYYAMSFRGQYRLRLKKTLHPLRR